MTGKNQTKKGGELRWPKPNKGKRLSQLNPINVVLLAVADVQSRLRDIAAQPPTKPKTKKAEILGFFC
jgi:hypothetical protein